MAAGPGEQRAVPDQVAAAAAAGQHRAPGRRGVELRGLQPYLLMAPAAIFLALFLVWPAVRALLITFQSAAGDFSTENFAAVFREADFRLALRNTLVVLVIVIPLEITIALLMATLAQQRLRGTNFFLYFWTLPLAVSDLAAGLVWLSVFTGHGYLNSVLQDLHLIQHPIGFLNYDNLTGLVVTVVVAETWRSISLVMVIVMSGVQAIPAELGEAAAVLGANGWRRFWHVTLPLLKPTLQVALILRTTAAFQVFAVVLVLTGSAFPVLATKAESWVYEYHNFQMAAVHAILLLGLSSASTLVYLVALRTPRQVFQR